MMALIRPFDLFETNAMAFSYLASWPCSVAFSISIYHVHLLFVSMSMMVNAI